MLVQVVRFEVGTVGLHGGQHAVGRGRIGTTFVFGTRLMLLRRRATQGRRLEDVVVVVVAGGRAERGGPWRPFPVHPTKHFGGNCTTLGTQNVRALSRRGCCLRAKKVFFGSEICCARRLRAFSFWRVGRMRQSATRRCSRPSSTAATRRAERRRSRAAPSPSYHHGRTANQARARLRRWGGDRAPMSVRLIGLAFFQPPTRESFCNQPDLHTHTHAFGIT